MSQRSGGSTPSRVHSNFDACGLSAFGPVSTSEIGDRSLYAVGFLMSLTEMSAITLPLLISRFPASVSSQVAGIWSAGIVTPVPYNGVLAKELEAS